MRLRREEEIREFFPKVALLERVMIAVLALLAIRLWYLQIWHGEKFFQFSRQNHLKQEKIVAPRGMIFDRKGTLLVDNRPSFQLVLTPQYVADKQAVIFGLERLLKIRVPVMEEIFQRARKLPKFQPIVVKEDLTRDEVALIETFGLDLPGISVQLVPKREYLLPAATAHFMGYLGEVTPEELKKLDSYCYGDRIGKLGIERVWEPELRGEDGVSYVEVDARGRRVSNRVNLMDYPPDVMATAGNNLVVTLDADLQRLAVEHFKDRVGAIVALDPNTGEVLVYVNQPSFDPTSLSQGMPHEQWDRLVSDPRQPLRNKVIQDHYPPGSIYKIIPLFAGLQEGIITSKSRHFCTGFFPFGGRDYRCWSWKDGGHGEVNPHSALVQSCDSFFYDLGLKLGVDKLASVATMFGLGSKTDILLPGERTGLVPSSQWKKKYLRESWYPGETLSVAIGQGYTTATPIQIARMYMAVANGGKLYKPYLVRQVIDPSGEILQEWGPLLEHQIPISESQLDFVRKALFDVVNHPTGTAYRLGHHQDILIAGKTGTAQVVRQETDLGKKCHELDFPLRDHAWFAAYAPYDHPRIVVAVLAEHDCYPNASAIPVAREIILSYLREDGSQRSTMAH